MTKKERSSAILEALRKAAAEIARPSYFGKHGNYVCCALDGQETLAADRAKDLFLKTYARGDGTDNFFFFGKHCGTFNGTSYDQVSELYNYQDADEHRLIALALLIALLEDGFWD